MLAKPGRAGKWSAFLQERKIPRATADRLVARHQQTLNPDANRLSGSIPEPTAEQVQKLFNAVWPKLRRTLTTPGSVYQFVSALASACASACFEAKEDGILVINPGCGGSDSPQCDDPQPEAHSGQEVAFAPPPEDAAAPSKHPIASLPVDLEFEDELARQSSRMEGP